MDLEDQIAKVKDLNNQAFDARTILAKQREEIIQANYQETLLFNNLSRIEFNLKVEQDQLLEMVRSST